MGDRLGRVASLSGELQKARSLEESLRLVAHSAAELLGVENVTVRLVDASRARLLLGCRAGAPLHGNHEFEFELGQGLVGWVVANNQPLRLGRAPEDMRFLPRDDQHQRFDSFLGVPLSHEGRCFGVLAATAPHADRFGDEDERVMTLLSGLCSPLLEIARLARLRRVDPLTGTLSAQALDDALPEIGPAGPLAIGLVDVDGLRELNERYGQAGGDEVLRAVGRALASCLRGGDAVVRRGGDEFLVVAAQVTREAAARVFDRARRAVEESAVLSDGRRLQATVSIGVAERAAGERRSQVVRRAEEALKFAKNCGGNCVRVAMELQT